MPKKFSNDKWVFPSWIFKCDFITNTLKDKNIIHKYILRVKPVSSSLPGITTEKE